MERPITARAGNQPRTKKRSRSGADTTCPHCAKKLRGEKGLKRHLTDQHSEVA